MDERSVYQPWQKTARVLAGCTDPEELDRAAAQHIDCSANGECTDKNEVIQFPFNRTEFAVTVDVFSSLPAALQQRAMAAKVNPVATVAIPRSPLGPMPGETDPLALQLAAEQHPLNPQQQEIVAAVVVRPTRVGVGVVSHVSFVSRLGRLPGP